VKLGIVISDLHIGTGHKKGQINIYDDFREDDRVEQLLARFSQPGHETHLILNGDIFDLLKVPVNGQFPDAITERLALMKLEQCLKGHPQVVRGFSNFLAQEQNQITYQPGNHDLDFFFPKVQEQFCRAITGHPTHPRLKFISEADHFTLEDGVQIHHGHQFEAIHAVDMKKMFLTQGNREPILNLPWGSLFILHVINKLVRERPHLDKVMPFWPLFAGGMLFDTRFTVRMVSECAIALVRARLNPRWWSKRPFEKVSRFLKNDVGFFEGLDSFANKMMKKNPALNAVFMGHTHMEMVRTWPKDKVYINTGTWIPMVNLRLSNLGQSTALHYGYIEWRPDSAPRVSLMRWHGQKPEAEEVIS
jgi:UDP-2,3-diacylglucosamine pyrophosphatase LpxH